MKRIALFFDRPYVDAHFCFTELARNLAERNFQVDLYHIPNPYNLSPGFLNDEIRVKQFPISKTQKLDFFLKALFTDKLKYDAIIGTPINGAVMGARIAKREKIPFFYLADEIFDPLTKYHSIANWEKAKRLDIAANNKAAASIALGEERYKYQKKVNHLPDSLPYFVIPNSPSGEVKKLQSSYFRDIFEIKDSKPIVLFIGTLGWNLAKLIYERTKEYRDKEYHLIFHGRTKGLMGDGNAHPFIKVSGQPLPSTLLNYAVSSADLGLVLYDKTIPQEQNNGWTGGKIGTYFKNGLPVIAGNLEQFKVFEEKNIGTFWDAKVEIDLIIKNTLNKITTLQKNIPDFYAEHYQYETFFDRFYSFLLKKIL